jgi:O-antigen ligase
MQGLDFYGFESYGYIILIERGIVGCIIEVIMMVSIFIYALQHRRKYKEEMAIIISILVGFIFFSFSTGTMGTFLMTMLFIGMAMSRIRIKAACLKEKIVSVKVKKYI